MSGASRPVQVHRSPPAAAIMLDGHVSGIQGGWQHLPRQLLVLCVDKFALKHVPRELQHIARAQEL